MSELVIEKDDIPEGWVTTILDQIIEPSKEKFEPQNSDNRMFLGLEHIESNSGRILGKGNSINTKSTKTIFNKGDVLYGKLRPYLNKVCVPIFDGVCSTDILVFSKNPYRSSKYIAYFLSQSKFMRFANRNSTGVQHPRIKFDVMSQFQIPLPPLNEQKRIVSKIESIFSQIDAAKEDLDNVKVVLKQNKQAVLKQAFEGKLTEKWRLTNKNNHTIKKQILKQISDELKLMKKNPVYIFGTLQKKDLFKIPTDWIWARLMNISQIGQGGTPSTKNKDYWDGKISWLRSGEIRNNYIYKSENYISDVGLTNSSTIMCPQETVLLAMTGQGLTRGRCAILKINACANQSVAHMILDHNRAFNKFLFYYLRFQYWRIRSVSKGSNQAGLNVSIIKQFDVPLPPIPEQKRIVQKIESIFARIDAIENSIILTAHIILRIKLAILLILFTMILYHEFYNTEKNIHRYHNSR